MYWFPLDELRYIGFDCGVSHTNACEFLILWYYISISISSPCTRNLHDIFNWNVLPFMSVCAYFLMNLFSAITLAQFKLTVWLNMTDCTQILKTVYNVFNIDFCRTLLKILRFFIVSRLPMTTIDRVNHLVGGIIVTSNGYFVYHTIVVLGMGLPCYQSYECNTAVWVCQNHAIVALV